MTVLIPSKSVNGHKLLREALIEFWNCFGGTRNSGEGYEKEKKLAELQRMSNVVVVYKHQSPLKERREKFNKSKNTRKRLRLKQCFVCGSPGTARHHIVQLKHGGINSNRNVVSLCDPCHAEIHPWLKCPSS